MSRVQLLCQDLPKLAIPSSPLTTNFTTYTIPSFSRLQRLCQDIPKLCTSSPSLTTSFTVFPRLCGELRNKIWMFVAMNEGREIRLGKVRHFHEENDEEHRGDEVEQPAFLQACQEARLEGMMYYSKVKESRRFVRIDENGEYINADLAKDRILRRYIYVNFAVDSFVWSSGYSPIDTTGLPMRTAHRVFGYRDFNFNTSVTQRIEHLKVDLRKCPLAWHLRSVGSILSNEHMRQITVIVNWWVRRGTGSVVMKEVHRQRIASRVRRDIEVQLSRDNTWSNVDFGIELAPFELNEGPRIPMARHEPNYLQYFLTF